MLMKLFVIAALCGVALAATPVTPGFKSGTMEISNGVTDSFSFNVAAAYNAYCTNLPAGYSCFLGIDYKKHAAGTQVVCHSTGSAVTECVDTSSEYVATYEKGLEKTYTMCPALTSDATQFITTTGTCTSATACVSSTDVEITSVRIYQSNGPASSNSITANCADHKADYTMKYVPVWRGENDGNTAFYTVGDATDAMFSYPSMIVDIVAGDEVMVNLDIDGIVDSSKKGVQFHFTPMPCGDYYVNGTMINEPCMASPSPSDTYKVYPISERMDDYMSGFIPLSVDEANAGTWAITPYVLASTASNKEVKFRYCVGVNEECASAFGASPSAFLSALILAVLAFNRQ